MYQLHSLFKSGDLDLNSQLSGTLEESCIFFEHPWMLNRLLYQLHSLFKSTCTVETILCESASRLFEVHVIIYGYPNIRVRPVRQPC